MVAPFPRPGRPSGTHGGLPGILGLQLAGATAGGQPGLGGGGLLGLPGGIRDTLGGLSAALIAGAFNAGGPAQAQAFDRGRNRRAEQEEYERQRKQEEELLGFKRQEFDWYRAKREKEAEQEALIRQLIKDMEVPQGIPGDHQDLYRTWMRIDPEGALKAMTEGLTPEAPTDDFQEYEFAKPQGYQGSLSDRLLEKSRAGRSINNTNVQHDVMGGQARWG